MPFLMITKRSAHFNHARMLAFLTIPITFQCPTVKTPEPVKRKDGGQTRKSGGQNKGEDASQFDRTKTSGRTPKSGKDNKSERKPKFKVPTKEEKKPESKGKKQEEVNKTVEIKQPRKANKTIQQVPDSQEQKGTNESDQRQRSGISAVEIVVIVFSLGIILAVICWFVYAYRHPQSRSGMFLIEVGQY